MNDFTFKFESPTPDGFDNHPGKANALNQTGSELHIPELYARVREYCKENPIPDYTSVTPHGGVQFRYEGGEFKPLDKESFDSYVSLDLSAPDQSDKSCVFTVAKQRSGQTLGIIDVDELPFFEVPTESVDLSKCNFADQPLVWNGDMSLTATFTEVPQYQLGTVSNFFDQWAGAIANAGEGAGCFSADHIHDAFGVAVPEGNYYLKEVETMNDTSTRLIVGDWKTNQPTMRFTDVDIPALAAESMQYYLARFGEHGNVEVNKQFFENVKNDSEYAWGWLCNLACPLMDAGLTHEAANRAAAQQMQHVFKIDITQHPHWVDFETQWTAAKATPVQAAVDTDATTNVSGKHWTQF